MSQMIHFRGAMKQEHLDFLSSLFPFRGLKEQVIEAIFSEISYNVSCFEKGETVFSENCNSSRVGFVISGEFTVQKKRAEDECITLNRLTRCGSFGILSVLSPDSEYPTAIRASTKGEILFIDGKDMIHTIKKYPTVSLNVIRFLADRITFLNKKIDTFSGKSTTKKLASYLFNKYNELGEVFTVSRTALASEIGVGRASLYRDLDFLEAEGIIRTEQKKIIIICPKGLERIKL